MWKTKKLKKNNKRKANGQTWVGDGVVGYGVTGDGVTGDGVVGQLPKLLPPTATLNTLSVYGIHVEFEN